MSPIIYLFIIQKPFIEMLLHGHLSHFHLLAHPLILSATIKSLLCPGAGDSEVNKNSSRSELVEKVKTQQHGKVGGEADQNTSWKALYRLGEET